MKEKNLFRKLFYIIPLMLVVFTCFYFIIIFFFNWELRSQQKEKSISLAFSLSQNALHSIIESNLTELQRLTNTIIKNKDVLGVQIRNNAGKVLTEQHLSKYKNIVTKDKDFTAFTPFKKQLSRQRTKTHNDTIIIRTDIPIHQTDTRLTQPLKAYGYICLYSSIKKSAISSKTKYAALLLCLILFTVSVFIIFMAFSFFIIPLKKINRSALELKHKNYRFRIKEKTKHQEEFSSLYHRINRIAQMLEAKEKKYNKTKQQLVGLQHDIDNIIKKHTSKLTKSRERINKAQDELMHLSAISLSNEIKSQIIEATANPITNSMLIIQDKLPKMLLIKKSEILNDFYAILKNWNKLFTENKLSDYFAGNTDKNLNQIKDEFAQLFSQIGKINENNETVLRFFFIFEKEFSRFVQIIDDLKSNIITEKNIRKISLRDVMKNVITILEQKINNGRIKIKTHFPETEPTVMADKNDIIYVIYNILLNSINAFEKKPLLDHRINIAIENIQGKKIVMTFEDNGPGINEKDIPHLFNPGFSGSNDSLGYGLCVSANIINGYHGKIELLKSDKNISTIFRVEIPHKA